MTTAIYTFLIVTLAAGLATAHALPLLSSNEGKQEDAQYAKVVNFLNTDPELRKYYNFRFTGTFPSIPEELQQKLTHSFPQYKFLLARMESTLHVTAVPLDLVIITDAETGGCMLAAVSPCFNNFLHGNHTPRTMGSQQLSVVVSNCLSLDISF